MKPARFADVDKLLCGDTSDIDCTGSLGTVLKKLACEPPDPGACTGATSTPLDTIMCGGISLELCDDLIGSGIPVIYDLIRGEHGPPVTGDPCNEVGGNDNGGAGQIQRWVCGH